MKKLLVLLLISALAIFVFAGCEGLVPSEGEGEGEGEGEEEVTVEIDGAVTIGNLTYVSAGAHDITVTFPAPVEGSVNASIGLCTGDYSKASGLTDLINVPVVLFPNDDRTVWTGSGDFFPGIDIGGLLDDDLDDLISYCCASYVYVTSGECEDETCIEFPVIVDSEDPKATIELCLDDCVCEGCELSFTSTTTEGPCADVVNCGDDCSGLASWSIAIYDEYPFNECCEIPCYEPLDSGSGTVCPIAWTTKCIEFDKLEDEDLFVVVNLVDQVGNDVQWGAWVGTCDYDTCGTIWVYPVEPDDCLDTAEGVFVICEDNEDCD